MNHSIHIRALIIIAFLAMLLSGFSLNSRSVFGAPMADNQSQVSYDQSDPEPTEQISEEQSSGGNEGDTVEADSVVEESDDSILEQPDATVDANLDPNIVGGSNSTPNRWPWQARLNRYGSFNCGGTLIAAKWVLTAKHCVSGYPNTAFTIILGDHLINTTEATEQSFSIVTIYQHGSADLALLELDRTATLNVYVKALPLGNAQSETVAQTSGVITGWGQTSGTNPVFSNILRQVGVGLVVCSTNTYEICTVPTLPYRGACYGDSGGPMYGGGRLVGIVSHGAPGDTTCSSMTYGVRVTQYARWVDDRINPKVGIIRHANGDCGPYEKIEIYMDDEDGLNDNNSYAWGWIGVNDNEVRNTKLTFCKVPANLFKPLGSTLTQINTHYAVLRVGDICPNGSSPFVRSIDNQNNDNTNWFSGEIYPNTSQRNPSWTELYFCLFRAGASRMSEFPRLSIPYGVFAAPNFIKAQPLPDGSIGTGEIGSDDEDVNNGNGFYGDANVLNDASRIIYPYRTTFTIFRTANVMNPIVPTVLNVTSTGTDFQLTWNNQRAIASYRIYRALRSTMQFALIKTVTPNTYLDPFSGLVMGSEYCYYVQGLLSTSAVAITSNTVCAMASIYQPILLSGNALSTGNSLGWNQQSTISNYIVYRALASTMQFSAINSTAPASYLDPIDMLLLNTSYCYYVQGYANGVPVGTSNTVCLTTPATTSFWLGLEPTEASIDTWWGTVSGATNGYRLYRNDVNIANTPYTSYLDQSSLQAGYNYCYYVEAYGNNGMIARSNMACGQLVQIINPCDSTTNRVCEVPLPLNTNNIKPLYLPMVVR